MREIPFHILDVFAERKFAGNQLAVCWDDGSLSSEEMQTIAREINFSETTFVAPGGLKEGGFDVRIFTPTQELPFAGHPTLGTAWALREFREAGNRVALNLNVGQIPVDFDADGRGEMLQNAPEFREQLSHDELAKVLSLSEDQLVADYPIQIVSTGMPALIVPLTDLKALGNAKVNRGPYDALIDRVGVLTLLVFCKEGQEEGQGLSARVFVDCVGIPEDPATGSAAGNLTGYLSQHEIMGTSDFAVDLAQGYEMGRPSTLSLKAKRLSEERIEVRVGGAVQLIGQGEWIV